MFHSTLSFGFTTSDGGGGSDSYWAEHSNVYIAGYGIDVGVGIFERETAFLFKLRSDSHCIPESYGQLPYEIDSGKMVLIDSSDPEYITVSDLT